MAVKKAVISYVPFLFEWHFLFMVNYKTDSQMVVFLSRNREVQICKRGIFNTILRFSFPFYDIGPEEPI